MYIVARLFGAVAVAAAALGLLGCTDASTSVAAPSVSKCENTATNQPTTFPANGGSGALRIGAGRDCTWSVSADASWIAFTGPRTGQGDAVVGYTVSENPVPSARSASLSVDSVRLPLSQAAAPCTFTVSPSDLSAGAEGGTLSVAVSTLAGCRWTAVSQVSWIVLSGADGDTGATIALAIAANGGGAREGAVTIGGRTVTVRQTGASGGAEPSPSPTPTPSPAPPPPPPPPPPSPSPSPSPPVQTVEFEGSVSNILGGCPDVTFVAADRVVIADRSTDFRKGSCRDLTNGDRVKVRGTTTTGSPVNATRIEFRDDND